MPGSSMKSVTNQLVCNKANVYQEAVLFTGNQPQKLHPMKQLKQWF